MGYPDWDMHRTWAIKIAEILTIAHQHQMEVTAQLISEEDVRITIEGRVKAPLYFLTKEGEIYAKIGDHLKFNYDLHEYWSEPLSAEFAERFPR